MVDAIVGRCNEAVDTLVSDTFVYNHKCVGVTFFLLGEDDVSDELLGTDVIEAIHPHLVPEVDHEVKNSLTSQDFVADVSAHHDGRLVLENVCGEAGPDGYPEELRVEERRGYNQT